MYNYLGGQKRILSCFSSSSVVSWSTDGGQIGLPPLKLAPSPIALGYLLSKRSTVCVLFRARHSVPTFKILYHFVHEMLKYSTLCKCVISGCQKMLCIHLLANFMDEFIVQLLIIIAHTLLFLRDWRASWWCQWASKAPIASQCAIYSILVTCTLTWKWSMSYNMEPSQFIMSPYLESETTMSRVLPLLYLHRLPYWSLFWISNV